MGGAAHPGGCGGPCQVTLCGCGSGRIGQLVLIWELVWLLCQVTHLPSPCVGVCQVAVSCDPMWQWVRSKRTASMGFSQVAFSTDRHLGLVQITVPVDNHVGVRVRSSSQLSVSASG